ncbi:MAG: response regulator [Bacteroidetes bacterium]|nr:response regulator [Bacteroidota bacterium]
MKSNTKKILIISHIGAERNHLMQILQLNGYETTVADNGQDGIALALQLLPDLILCEAQLPTLSGYDVLLRLEKNPNTTDVPFIFLSAQSEKEDYRKGMSLGADDYIAKPYDMAILLQTIEYRLRKRERIRATAPTNPPSAAFDRFLGETKAQEALIQLADNREVRHYKKRDIIFKEHDYPHNLFYVECGEVKLFKSNMEGRELILRIAGPGSFLGYLALLQEQAYTENAAVLESATLRVIPKEDFYALVYGNPNVTSNFLKILAHHIYEQEQQLLDLAYNSVRKRVAQTIVWLHEQGKGNLHLLRDDLAAIVGTAKETLIRVLAELKNEGLIAVEDGDIKVLKMEKLRKVPN